MKHQIRWFGISHDENGRPVRIPRNGIMRDKEWGWDATCTCGWDSRSGGFIAVRIREAIADHKRDVKSGLWDAQQAGPAAVDAWLASRS